MESSLTIDKWFPSSKLCHVCGYVNYRLTLSDRAGTCESCGAHHQRDITQKASFGANGFDYSPLSALHRTVGRTGEAW
ncbi:MAG: transposase [Christensenellaceae bacterium]|nr:transposase [Christensenellaceae bacterium]